MPIRQTKYPFVRIPVDQEAVFLCDWCLRTTVAEKCLINVTNVKTMCVECEEGFDLLEDREW